MGILAMNILAFALPYPAYANPAAYGGATGVNLASWFASFVLIDGKMRGLFSILFGASTLLVIQKAEEAGRDGLNAHFRRMIFLLLFGLVHFYFIWFGDILALYALCGFLLYPFRNLSPRALGRWAIGLLMVSFLIFSLLSFAATASTSRNLPAEVRAELSEARTIVETEVGARSPRIERDLALYRGPYAGIVEHRIERQALFPFMSLPSFGWETIGLMLIGMVLFRTGFLTGAWDRKQYRKWAMICFAIGITGATLLALLQIESGFAAPMVLGAAVAFSMPFDVLMAIGWAAVVILWAKRSAGGRIVERVAAVGRMAFTNYLATSIVMTTLFYGFGFGLFGTLHRAALWAPVIAMWLLMLGWSKPWLDRFRYGPFEWLWRSLSRGQIEALRRS